MIVKNICISGFVFLVLLSVVCVFHKSMKPSCCIYLDIILYKERVLKSISFAKVLVECRALHMKLQPEPQYALAVGRQTVTVPHTSYIHRLFYSQAVLDVVGGFVGSSCVVPSSQPIEYRLYVMGSSMPWHRDDVITRNCPQIEVVFTVYNHSDSYTEWYDDRLKGIHRIRTKPNSMVITQGLGAFHQVTPLTSGERSILKVVYNLGLDA